jgi:hypothetical protein
MTEVLEAAISTPVIPELTLPLIARCLTALTLERSVDHGAEVRRHDLHRARRKATAKLVSARIGVL